MCGNFFQKYFLRFLFSGFLVLLSIPSFSQSKTEADLIQHIVNSLQRSDSFGYANVFLSTDSFATMCLRKAPATTEAYQNAVTLKNNPVAMMLQDSFAKMRAFAQFKKVYERGERIEIHWLNILNSRYELEQVGKTRDLALEAVAPDRFVGYLFVKDMLSTKHYVLSLADIMKIDGKWYGGLLNYIFEADSKEEFNEKLKAEKKRIMRGIPDTLGQYADSVHKMEAKEESAISQKRKQVADRKLYLGYLDNDIPVDLYIRFIKGDCPEKICSWEAMMKFGDNDFLPQEVTHNPDGKWVFTEDGNGGVLEMELKGSVFEGIFLETNDRIDYDAFLEEVPLSNKKMQKLDAIIEQNMKR